MTTHDAKVGTVDTFKGHTPGPWEYAADSYGKVRHSKKACVYTNLQGDGGDRLVNIAGRIESWADARLIASAPALLAERDALKVERDEITAHAERLAEALENIAHHPSGWPPPEEENSSMRGIASTALSAWADRGKK